MDNTSDHKHNPNLQADIHSAMLAYDAWKSNDPKQETHAEAEKSRILASDPEAWRIAMHKIDVREKKEHDAKNLERQKQMQVAENQLARDQAETARIQAQNDARLAAERAAAPVRLPDETVVAPVQNGYAPTSEYAPAPPASPGYASAYNKPPAKFYGLNLGIVKLGVNNHGSLDVGVNVGLAKTEVQVGLENRVDAEAFPFANTPLHARVGAGVGIDRDGLHAQAGGGFNVFNAVNADADGGFHMGQQGIGVDGDARGKVIVAEGQGAGGVSLGDQGVSVYTGGNANLAGAIGGRAGGRLDVGPHTGIAAGAGITSDGQALDFGPSADVYPDGSTSGGVHLESSWKDHATYYPTGDRELDNTGY